MKQLYRFLSILFAFTIILSACGPAAPKKYSVKGSIPAATEEVGATAPENDQQAGTVPTEQPTDEPPQQPKTEPVKYGPDPADFPTGINPLTGEPASNPSYLNLPAVLISITNFPPSSRPQAGLSFAPFVFEMFISEGMTRFLAAFYGDYPKIEGVPTGSCDVRKEPFVKTDQVIGSRVWWDKNGDGVQDAGEPGVGGACVKLYDADSGALVQSTSTDTNGFYGFNVPEGVHKFVEFALPAGFGFTSKDVGDDTHDSDADPSSGRTAAFTVAGDALAWDAGIVQTSNDATFVTPVPTKGKKDPISPEIGPVRSGRLPYAHIRDFFQWSCLVYGSASKDVEARLRGCQMVYGSDTHDINSAMIDVTKVEALAEENKHPGEPFNYTGNLFSESIPAGGVPVTDLMVFYSLLNQSKWVYDPLYDAWLRYTDQADGSGVFVPDTDRLTGKQIYFDNVIVMIANHIVESPSKIDIEIGIGNKGEAYLFRDGRMYKINWTTKAGDYEKSTGLRRPVQFTDESGNPVALKPGHTWVHIMTPFSFVTELSPGQWKARFIAPAGAK
jgi:hypothetical protein